MASQVLGVEHGRVHILETATDKVGAQLILVKKILVYFYKKSQYTVLAHKLFN